MSPSENFDQHQLAQRLRETRELLNVSQQFVAEQTGLPRTAVSDIERGVRKVDALELKRLARLYRFPVAYFLGSESQESLPPAERAVGGTVAASGQPAELAALLRTASELTDEDRQQMLRFALFLRGYEEKSNPAVPPADALEA